MGMDFPCIRFENSEIEYTKQSFSVFALISHCVPLLIHRFLHDFKLSSSTSLLYLYSLGNSKPLIFLTFSNQNLQFHLCISVTICLF